MAVDKKILHKVRALLNLAQNGGDPASNEAQSALLMAQRLMAENGINEVEVRDSAKSTPPKEVLDDYATEFEKLSWWKKSLGRVIAQNFRCYSYLNKCKGYTRLAFMGLKEDTEIAIMAFSFATDYIRFGADQFMKAYRKDYLLLHGHRLGISQQRGVRNNYVEGWISGLEAQYNEQVSKEGWGLVLMKDELVTQTYKDMDLKRGQSPQYTRVNTSAGQVAYSKGYSDGKGFSSAAHGRLR
ncbi:DUF2786 domain-containing protein [Desulfosporosinus sp. BICA1-9]|uniref:DUF2786 domain-containing protein n=1 Tax=Desulfosporosinus sp. BICA1-9 TaxID=1531958 RepID=UPI00054B570F|nr:DUF2786 domain-containing protein [Desulfosporosinus sp. BICA1-9]KJS46963.1 MAG: hypothetical protein VR66_22385 [Peptococcaceae bacterium BRH_c23]KJS80675.1 MAG: hypothetical protein JL57_27725 [Desulfosporosinus sp. BICA1-9]HBW36522.1 DUF2786 domain-containing protein [Desulfosporosinus sp.]